MTDPLPDFSRAVARYADPSEVDALRASVLARLDWRLRRGHKMCETCGQAKPVTAFGQHSRELDGLRRACRDCRSTK